MGKAAKKVETKSGVKGKVTEVEDKGKLKVDESDTEFRKPGKIRNGKLQEDGSIKYEDEEDPTLPTDFEEEDEDSEDDVTSEDEDEEALTSEDDEDEEDEPEPVKKKGKAVSDSKGSVEIKDGVLKLKPSQLPTPPASQRKVVEKPKGYKGDIVTIKDLEDEYGFDGKKIRRIIRNIGLKAPEAASTGFGAKARYEFPVDSKDLKKVRKALEEERGS